MKSMEKEIENRLRKLEETEEREIERLQKYLEDWLEEQLRVALILPGLSIGSFKSEDDEDEDPREIYAKIRERVQRILTLLFGSAKEVDYYNECNDDEALHFKDAYGRIWHVCTSDFDNVTISLCDAWLLSILYPKVFP